MFKKQDVRERLGFGLVLVFMLSLVLPVFPMEQVAVAEGNVTQTIGDLDIGDKVVDNSWQWEHRLGPATWDGDPYSGTGETKPVTWIVVAKNHYTGGDAGSVAGGVSHVTLITEELIGKHTFDNSTNGGSDHWGNSGHPDATHGIRKFLNGSSYSGSDTNTYDHTFYDAMSSDFKSGVLSTTLPNKVWDTEDFYTTDDKVFLPSTTEIGDTTHSYTYPIGENWGYFTDNASRTCAIGENNWTYWTRSPHYENANLVRYIPSNGGFSNFSAHIANRGVRPALNLSSEIPISGIPNENGVYEIIEGNGNGPENGDPEEDCYIATAVYGSYHAPEVVTLRSFRDEVLKKSLSGQLFIKAYYTLSPPVADYLAEAETLNSWVRKLLDGFVGLINNTTEE